VTNKTLSPGAVSGVEKCARLHFRSPLRGVYGAPPDYHHYNFILLRYSMQK